MCGLDDRRACNVQSKKGTKMCLYLKYIWAWKLWHIYVHMDTWKKYKVKTAPISMSEKILLLGWFVFLCHKIQGITYEIINILKGEWFLTTTFISSQAFFYWNQWYEFFMDHTKTLSLAYFAPLISADFYAGLLTEGHCRNGTKQLLRWLVTLGIEVPDDIWGRNSTQSSSRQHQCDKVLQITSL